VGAGEGPQDFSKLTGEMSVASALKFFAQQSKLPNVRRFVTSSYTRAFATQ
jgi:conjugal transfer pilus assembly protein TrbC